MRSRSYNVRICRIFTGKRKHSCRMITCTRRIQFSAGHRVYRHESKCAHLHGHNYVALFTATAVHLDDLGRVIDFGVLKDKIGGWIEQWWDHGMIINRADPLIALWEEGGLLYGQKIYSFPDNPTAEEMARYLLVRVCPFVLDKTGVEVIAVRLWETENCYADATHN